MDEESWASELAKYTYTPEAAIVRRPNVFSIAGFPNSEIVSSNMLAWLFDPSANHGLANLALGSLLDLIGCSRDAIDEVEVETEAVTARGNRIDILVTMTGFAVAVENKVKAGLYNNLGDYWECATDGGDRDAVVVVLSQNEIVERADSRRTWGLTEGENLFYLTYDRLFDKILQGLGGEIMDADPRGVDLLMQYIDNYSPERNEKAMEDIDDDIRRFTSRSEGIERQIIASRIDFDAYTRAVETKLTTLVDDLKERIHEGFEDPQGGTVTVIDCWHGPKTHPAYHSMTFHIDGRRDVSIELITDTNPSHINDWVTGDSPIANGEATFDTLIYKAYYEVGRHANQRRNALESRLLGIVDGARLSEPIEELKGKVLEQYLRLLEKAWNTEIRPRELKIAADS